LLPLAVVDLLTERRAAPRAFAEPMLREKHQRESLAVHLNVVYDEIEKRGIIRLNLVSLTFTIFGIVAMLIASGAVVVAPLVVSRIGLGVMTEAILSISRWPATIDTMAPSLRGRTGRSFGTESGAIWFKHDMV